jgi:hypothetical protein
MKKAIPKSKRKKALGSNPLASRPAQPSPGRQLRDTPAVSGPIVERPATLNPVPRMAYPFGVAPRTVEQGIHLDIPVPAAAKRSWWQRFLDTFR